MFSVIIPALNEEKRIERCLRRVRELKPEAEIIVADGGSSDGTVSKAHACGARVVASPASRGMQCNAGAHAASGGIFLFLHADTLLPHDAFSILNEQFSRPEVQIGTFRLAFDRDNIILRAYASFTSHDSIFTRFGDQCIVVRKSFFYELGGFPDWPLFEDVHFLRTARRRTKIVSFPAEVITSARRFVRLGIVRNQILNAWIFAQYLCGVAPEKLAARYSAL